MCLLFAEGRGEEEDESPQAGGARHGEEEPAVVPRVRGDDVRGRADGVLHDGRLDQHFRRLRGAGHADSLGRGRHEGGGGGDEEGEEEEGTHRGYWCLDKIEALT